jgi:hypothetical protein
MGVLSKFEQRLGGAVEGSFSRVFRSRVEPVELAVALKKEADSHRSVFASQTRVPNRYEIDLGPGDYDRLAPYRFTLGDELAEMVREHAHEQRYAFVGPVEVTLVRAEDLRTGAYRVGSRVEESERERTPPPVMTPPAAPPPPVVPPVRVPVPEPTAVIPEGATQAIPRPVTPTYGRLELPNGERVQVRDRPVVLGRGHEADVRIADASVSRRHAEVRYDGERVLVEDLGSTNGTSVNGERIARATLVAGDRLTLGAATVIFRAGDD